MCLELKASVVWTSRSCGSFHFIPWGTPRILASKDHLGSFHFTSYVTSKDNWFSHSGIKIKSQHISLDIFKHIRTIGSLVQGSGTSKNKSFYIFTPPVIASSICFSSSGVQSSENCNLGNPKSIVLQFRCKNLLRLFITWGTPKTTAAIPLSKKFKGSGSFGMISLLHLWLLQGK